MTDTHNGCESCGIHATIDFIEGRGYLCGDCLRKEDERPSLSLISACEALAKLQQEAEQSAPVPARWKELDVYHMFGSVFFYYLGSDTKDVAVSDAVTYVQGTQ